MHINLLHNASLPVLEGVFSNRKLSITEIIEFLSGKILISFHVEATGANPYARGVQIIRISAAAVNADTGEIMEKFVSEAGLSIPTVAMMQQEDEESVEDRSGEPTIRDMLNAANYDPDRTDLPDNVETAVDFKLFVDKLIGPETGVLVAYNAEFCMRHLNAILPRTHLLRGIPVFNLIEFTKLYFEPMLYAMMLQGSNKAHEMYEKLLDLVQMRPSYGIQTLSGALGVKRPRWRGSDSAEQIAAILSGMIKFLYDNRKMFGEPEFRRMGDQAALLWRKTR